MVVPLAFVNWPLLVPPPVKARMPLCTCARPELLKDTLMVEVPVPALLRSVPAFANRGLPELMARAVPSACRSNVPLDALLKRAELMQLIWPAVQVAEALFRIVPPLKFFVPAVLKAAPPLSTSIPGEFALPKAPDVQANDPDTIMVLLAVRVPPLSVRLVT